MTGASVRREGVGSPEPRETRIDLSCICRAEQDCQDGRSERPGEMARAALSLRLQPGTSTIPSREARRKDSREARRKDSRKARRQISREQQKCLVLDSNQEPSD
jgi:hypothetical protein